jgi:hypothetical protein
MPSKADKERRMQSRRDLGNRRFGAGAKALSKSRAVYRIAHACFDCRKSFKISYRESGEAPCPDCGGIAYSMGRSFKAPAATDREQWRKVQALFAHGFRFFSYRSYRCAPLPERYRELKSFLANNPEHPFLVAEPRPDLLSDLR